MPSNLVCLVCAREVKLLDTKVESSSPYCVIRVRLLECSKCGTVRIYRFITEVKDMGEDTKRYLRTGSGGKKALYSR